MKLAAIIGLVALGLGSAEALGADRDVSRHDRGRHYERRDDHHDHHQRRVSYSVVYRRHHDDHWHLYGTFQSRHAADHAHHDLEHRGFHARVEAN